MKLNRRLTRGLAIMAAAAACVSTLFAPGVASAATLTSLTLTPANPTKSAATTTYTFAISSSSAAAKCVRVHFSNSTTFSGTLPGSMSFSTPVLTGNATGYTTTTSSDYVQGTHASGVTLTSLTITNVNNMNAAGTLYAYIETWGNVDCSTGGVVDSGTVATAITDNTIVSVTVDPSFTFTVGNQSSACNGESNFVSGAGSSTGVALGNMAVSANKSGGQLLTVSGNSGGGYAVYLRGTFASTNLRSAGHNWVDVAGTYASPAALGAGERFGYTYKDNESAGTVSNPASATFIALDNATTNKVMDADNTASSGTGCVSYDAQTGSSTPAGTYQATIIYTAVPVY